MSSSTGFLTSSPARVPHDVARLAALAVLWVALWATFLLFVAYPAARLHAYGASRAPLASAALAEGGRP